MSFKTTIANAEELLEMLDIKSLNAMQESAKDQIDDVISEQEREKLQIFITSIERLKKATINLRNALEKLE